MPPVPLIKSHKAIMTALIRLADRYQGKTSPNPVVAAAVIKNGVVISRGAHHRAGEPHAEVMAIRPVLDQCKGATLLVTLEPCTHFGRTPPCTDLIISSGIRRVVYAMDDPNPVVRENTAKTVLGAAGIEVESGLCEDLAIESNRVYIKNRVAARPYVTLKAAISLDGRIALENGQSKYITSSASLHRVHQIRAQHDAIMIGVGTVIADDPELSIRLGKQKPTFKTLIILDPQLRTPDSARIWHGRTKDQLIIATTKTPTAAQQKRATYIQLPSAPFNLDDLLSQCFALGIYSVMVEGGSRVYSDCLTQGVVDRVHFFIAPVLMMGKRSIPVLGSERSFQTLDELLRLTNVQVKRWQNYTEISGDLS